MIRRRLWSYRASRNPGHEAGRRVNAGRQGPIGRSSGVYGGVTAIWRGQPEQGSCRTKHWRPHRSPFDAAATMPCVAQPVPASFPIRGVHGEAGPAQSRGLRSAGSAQGAIAPYDRAVRRTRAAEKDGADQSARAPADHARRRSTAGTPFKEGGPGRRRASRKHRCRLAARRPASGRRSASWWGRRPAKPWRRPRGYGTRDRDPGSGPLRAPR